MAGIWLPVVRIKMIVASDGHWVNEPSIWMSGRSRPMPAIQGELLTIRTEACLQRMSCS